MLGALHQQLDSLGTERFEAPAIPSRVQPLDQRRLNRSVQFGHHRAHDQAGVPDAGAGLLVVAERLASKQQRETAQDRDVELVLQHFDTLLSKPPPPVLARDQYVGPILQRERSGLGRAEDGGRVETAVLKRPHDGVCGFVHAQPPAIGEVDQSLWAALLEVAGPGVPMLVVRSCSEEAGRVRMVIAIVGRWLRREYLTALADVAGGRRLQQTGHVGHAAKPPVVVDPAVLPLEVGVAHAEAGCVVGWQHDHSGARLSGLLQCAAHRAAERVGAPTAHVDDLVAAEIRLTQFRVIQFFGAPVVVAHAALAGAFGQQEAVHAGEAQEKDGGPCAQVQSGRRCGGECQAEEPTRYA